MSRKRRLLAAVAGALIVPALLTACSGAGSQAGKIATYLPDENAAAEGALLSGTLMLDKYCTYVWVGETNETWLPVFPEGQAASEDDGITYQGSFYAEGAAIDLGGGVVTEPTAPALLPNSLDIPRGCATDYVWLVAAD